MAKQKIKQEIYNQYYSALEKGFIDKICENYLLGDILGTMRNNVLKVSDVLEALSLYHYCFFLHGLSLFKINLLSTLPHFPT